MSIPYYTKHLSTSPVVDYNGLSLLSPYSELSPVAFAQYGFVPGFLDNLAPVLIDTPGTNPRLVPPGPLTLFNPLNPFEEPITLTPSRNTLIDALLTSGIANVKVTKTFSNSLVNVQITGTTSDVDKVMAHLQTLR